MGWLDQHQLGYLAWSWNSFGACVPNDSSRAWSLVQDYYTARPNSDYAQAFYDRVALPAP